MFTEEEIEALVLGARIIESWADAALAKAAADVVAKVEAVLPEGLRDHVSRRSEEHTSELQSLMRISYAVFCLKKKTTTTNNSRVQMTQEMTPSIQTIK